MRAIDADKLIGRIRAQDFKDPADWWTILNLIDDAPTLTELPKPKKKTGRPAGSRTRRKVSRETILRLMKEKRINAAMLDARTGYTKSYIRQCIYHESMSPDMLAGVARCLGVSPIDLEGVVRL